jgi:hypothetical protein
MFENLFTTNSFFFFNNNLDNQFFLLDLDDIIVRQSVYNHTYLYMFSVSVYDIASFVTDTLFVPICIGLYYMYKKPLNIIF